jgi:hypothetical protein
MTLRELFQFSSIPLSLWLLLEVLWRIRRYKDALIFHSDTLRGWSAFIVIAVMTSVYYGFVFYDAYISDIFVAGDWSAALRSGVLAALIIHVRYQPRGKL